MGGRFPGESVRNPKGLANAGTGGEGRSLIRRWLSSDGEVCRSVSRMLGTSIVLSADGESISDTALDTSARFQKSRGVCGDSPGLNAQRRKQINALTTRPREIPDQKE